MVPSHEWYLHQMQPEIAAMVWSPYVTSAVVGYKLRAGNVRGYIAEWPGCHSVYTSDDDV